MSTPPTPAEVAEARAWFDERPHALPRPDQIVPDFYRHAAVLVRYALAGGERAALADGDAGDTTRGSGAAPAEQPREDHPDIGTVFRELRDVSGMRWQLEGVDPDDVTSFSAAEVLHMLDAARSVSPSAVPAVSDPSPSAGGAGRDLTAQDVQDAARGWALIHPLAREHIADHLNAIARPADTGTQATQATEQTTEYRVVMDFGPRWMTVTADEVAAELRAGRRMEQRSVSPWSPVDVHDEEQQR